MSGGQVVRRVKIPACVEHGGLDALTLTLTMRWTCLHCGGPRGEPFVTVSYDGSRRLTCHGWTNPCGHVEKYSEIRAVIRAATAKAKRRG